MRKIALFGGTFDPPHNGHIHMMLLAKEKYGFDEVYIIPTNKNPFKETKTGFEKRLEMCRRAFGGFPWCKVLDIEAQREGVSYTIDTVEHLVKNDPHFSESLRYFLLGQEAAYSLAQWKSADLLIALVQPVVISGENFDEGLAHGASSSLLESLKRGWTREKPLCLSSTVIRERIAQNLPVEHLVSSSVLSYIVMNRVYRRR